ncbi:hypothetical protein HKX48_006499 [Thoreauomyces humboldtii]|nr:hypothetical protein HKX48_006499 [Thoreauomyces humboldtii]
MSSSSNSSAFDINVPAPIILSLFMLCLLGITINNIKRTKIYPLFWVAAYTLIRCVAFVMRLYVRSRPDSTESEIDTKITLLVVDSVLYSAGYFFLFNAVLGCLVRWIDPSGQKQDTAGIPTRFFKYIHIAIIAGTSLSMYGGIKLTSLPHTDAQVAAADPNATADTIDESKKLRIGGVCIMVAVAGIMMFAILTRLSALSHRVNATRAAAFMLTTLTFLAIRAACSLAFVNGTSKMTDEAYLYGFAIAPEIPAVILLCLTPCLRWFEQKPGAAGVVTDSQGLSKPYTVYPTVMPVEVQPRLPGYPQPAYPYPNDNRV